MLAALLKELMISLNWRSFRLTAAVSKLPQSLGPNYWSQSVGDQLQINAGFQDQTGQGTPKQLIARMLKRNLRPALRACFGTPRINDAWPGTAWCGLARAD